MSTFFGFNRSVTALASGSALLLSLALVPSQPAEAAVTKYRSAGAGAYASWYNSCSYLSVEVSDSNSTAGTSDFLYYSGHDCDGNYFYGYGEVPDGVVKSVQGGKQISLSVDVNTLSGYYHYGTPLAATITWKVDGTCSSKSASHGQYTYNYDNQSITYKYNDKSDSSCADASGNIGGPVSFSGTTENAYIYSNRSMSREFIR